MRFLDRFVYRNPKPHKGKGMLPFRFSLLIFNKQCEHITGSYVTLSSFYISENTDSVVMQPKRKHFMNDIRSLAGKYKAWTVETGKIVQVSNTQIVLFSAPSYQNKT